MSRTQCRMTISHEDNGLLTKTVSGIFELFELQNFP